MIGDRKIMVTIVWNPHGFYLIDALPKGQAFNATYYVNLILQPLLDGRSSGPGADLMIRADNARPHAARKTLNFCLQNHLGIAPRPPYSPDLAPYDSFLFGDVKRALEGAEFPSEEALLAAIQSVLSHLMADTLSEVFAKWVERMNWVALNEGHYYR
jgi:histone-lysine N-methyltransferase SETMAR